jgi:hypothetical protein
MVNSIRQLELLPCSASATVLRGVGGVTLDSPFTSVLCFVPNKIKKHAPCSIRNAFINAVKIVFLHVVNRQIFNTDRIESIYNFTGKLMAKIVALICNPFVCTRNHLARFRSCSTGFLLRRESALNPSQHLFFLTKKARIFNLFAIRQGGKIGQSHVNSNRRLNWIFHWVTTDIAGECYKPFPGWRASDCTSFYYAFNRSVELDFNAANLRKSENVFKKFKTRLRECKRVVAKSASKSRKARRFTSFDAPKKCSKGEIDSCGNILKNLAENIKQKRVFLFECFKAVTLIISAQTLLFRFPCGFALFKKMIVQPTTSIKRLFKDCSLLATWKNSISKRFSHIYTLLLV